MFKLQKWLKQIDTQLINFVNRFVEQKQIKKPKVSQKPVSMTDGPIKKEL